MKDFACLREELASSNHICFTMDTDWASENVIKSAVDYFVQQSVPLTVFCTNKSPFLDYMADSKRIDLAIHPNFIQPSSQGETFEEIIDFCVSLAPGSIAFRCHRWFASNDVYELLYKKGFRYESNLCTLLDVVPPFVHRSGMISFPVFFEDGAYLYHKMDLHFNSIKKHFQQTGLKVIDIHPMHFVMNTSDFNYMKKIKSERTYEQWNSLVEEDICNLKNNNWGVSDLIKEIIDFSEKCKVVTLSEVYKRCKI